MSLGPRQLPVAGNFHFRADGSFTVLQFTDTHYIAGDPRSQRALDCVQEALEAVKPDLVIHTGDIVFGRPDIESAMEILAPLAQSGIPWAVALGNHDSQFGSTREDMFKAIRSLPGCVNLPPKSGVYGCSNDVLTLSGAGGVEHVLYLFDSMDAVILKGEEEIHCYDYIRHSQIGWYRSHSERFTEMNGGRPLPSLAFFHIPLPELSEALAKGIGPIAGNNGEPPCPSRLNSGLFAQFREMGDVQAIVTGHDHDCDYFRTARSISSMAGSAAATPSTTTWACKGISLPTPIRLPERSPAAACSASGKVFPVSTPVCGCRAA